MGFSPQDESYNFTRVAISGDMPGDFRLTNLEKFTKYTVVVQAVNSIGEGPNSDPFSVLTLEDGGCKKYTRGN